MRFCRILFGYLNAVLLLAGTAVAQESLPPVSQYQVKAAFLFNFAKFCEWPPDAFHSPESPMIIGILGDNPFGDNLRKEIHNRTINERRVEIREVSSLSEATNCQVLFISPSEKKRLSEILEALGQNSILTVSEIENFAQQGGMINFVWEGKKIRFQINEEAARKVRLKMSSKLVGLAVPYKPKS